MRGQYEHAVLSRPTQDELGREAFLGAMREFVIADLFPGNTAVYEAVLKPQFESRTGRAPKTYLEVKELMHKDFYYNMFSLLNRSTQELLWDTVGESIERQLPALKAAAAMQGGAGGSLRLAPDFLLPAYARKVDIHVMPGSFHTELTDDDLFAGALYDRGVYVYAYAGLGPRNDALGHVTGSFVAERFPEFRPRRILDLGCGAGMSTLPLAEIFPDAEIYGVDIAAPMLRYGHARAEAMGVPVHLSQQNAGHTDFADGSFDLVLSNLLLHEIPQKLSKQILVEAHRLLAPGGITVHNDMCGWPTDPFQEFMAEWNSHHNNEPFERGSGTLKWQEACEAAGFPAESVFIQPMGAAYMEEQLAFVGFRGAVKAN